MVEKLQLMAEIIDHLNNAYQAVNSQSREVKKITGISRSQLWALQTIKAAGSVRVSNLASRMCRHPATVIGILNRLESNGLIIRVRNDNDRRSVNVELTDMGQILLETAPKIVQGYMVPQLEKVSLKDLQMINVAMKELLKGLERL